METITKQVEIPANHHLHLELEVPLVVPAGAAEVQLLITSLPNKANGRNRLREILGTGQGRTWMASDFDAPLTDFAGYS